MKQLSRSTLTSAFLASFLIGIAASSFFALPQLGLSVVVIAGLLGAYLLRKRVGWILMCLLLTGFSAGLLRYESAEKTFDENYLAHYNDQKNPSTIIGIVAEDPDRRADHTKLVVAAEMLKAVCSTKLPATEQLDCDRERNVHGQVLVKVPKLPEYNYGDELKITGRLETPFETEEFSYRDYLARYEIYSTLSFPRVFKTGDGHGNPILKNLYGLKRSIEDKINQIFPEPSASFAAGLLTGSRRGIPADVTADLNTTGLTHIIAISGYNIALVIAFVTGLVGTRVVRRWQFPLVTVFVVLFTLFVGAGPSVVRAAIMGLLAFYALTHGRQYNAALALLLTATAMVAVNPKILLSDVSFQLSFAAVTGLIYIAPLLEKWTEKIPNKFAVRESLVMTLSAQVFATPLIVFYFDRLSLIAPLANLLVAPAIPLAMLVGTFAVLASFIFLPLGILVGSVGYGILNYILFVAEKLAAIPLASVEMKSVGLSIFVVYYALVIAFLTWHKKIRLSNAI